MGSETFYIHSLRHKIFKSIRFEMNKCLFNLIIKLKTFKLNYKNYACFVITVFGISS